MATSSPEGTPTIDEVEARWIGGGKSYRYLRSGFRRWLAGVRQQVVEDVVAEMYREGFDLDEAQIQAMRDYVERTNR